MSGNIVIRLIDLTLLLLLSLLSVVKINEYEVRLPHSTDLSDQGSVPNPVRAAVAEDGTLFAEGAGSVNASDLAQISIELNRPVELRVDQGADAARLMEIHSILESAKRPAVFIVEHSTR